MSEMAVGFKELFDWNLWILPDDPDPLKAL